MVAVDPRKLKLEKEVNLFPSVPIEVSMKEKFHFTPERFLKIQLGFSPRISEMLWYLIFQGLLVGSHGSFLENFWKSDSLSSTCGISKRSQYQTDEQESFIVGGRDADKGEFPWQVSIQRHFEKNNGIYHICGGTIIAKDWVLTAAHCIRISKILKYRIVAGTNDLLDENKVRSLSESSYSVHKVFDAYVHEAFSTQTLQNDIALLKVEPSFDLDRSDGMLKAACLPPPHHEPYGYAVVSGWGTMKEGSRVIPTKLQAVAVPIITDNACRKAYGKAIVETMLCAGYEEGMRDSCQGDSGGPLVQKSGYGPASIVGVVSWGQGCARPKFPGVYTQVSYYIDWINRIIKTEDIFDDINKFPF
ncbi:Trypsin-1 like protein [Argiope bruennichi]|uniref:Trypsin-1 like protein n=1 Tax=Argiope bruennichi TaxID=94029 RepID=A0A8T0FJE7_ARGBR|nr:Trypsin-1 like protein [Argiope bruennichi]